MHNVPVKISQDRETQLNIIPDKPISLHLCIISFFFKVKLYKKKITTEKISNYWTRPNFTDCIKKGLGYMIVTVFNFLWFAVNWE
jgi:hypothetical protein